MESLKYQYSITYQNDIQNSYMVIELAPKDEIIDYQVQIMQENPTVQLLSLHKKQIDDRIYLFYNITSKITLGQLLKRKKFNKHELLTILKSLIMALKLGNTYLLRGGSFLLDSELLYADPATLELAIAYMPITGDQEVSAALKKWLMDLLIYQAVFISASEGEFIYQLLDLLKKESFSLSELDRLVAYLAIDKSLPPVEHSLDGIEMPIHYQKSEKSLSHIEILNDKPKVLLIFSQLFFIALTIVLIRFLQAHIMEFDISKAVGLTMIMLAVDFLSLKKLKLLNKRAPLSKESKKHVEELRMCIGQPPNKQKRVSGGNTVQQSIGDANSSTGWINPREMYTQVLTGEEHNLPYLIAMGVDSHEKIHINKPNFIIGRVKAQADFVSKNNSVGKLHAEILYKENGYYIKDLNSRNGTYINGERIVSNVEHAIQNNDRISFANSEYKFYWS